MEPQDIDNGFTKLRTRVEVDSYTDMHHLPDDFWGCVQCGLVVWDRDVHVDKCPRSEEKDIEVQKPTGCLLCGHPGSHNHSNDELAMASAIYTKHYKGYHADCHPAACPYM